LGFTSLDAGPLAPLGFHTGPFTSLTIDLTINALRRHAPPVGALRLDSGAIGSLSLDSGPISGRLSLDSGLIRPRSHAPLSLDRAELGLDGGGHARDRPHMPRPDAKMARLVDFRERDGLKVVVHLLDVAEALGDARLLEVGQVPLPRRVARQRCLRSV